ncbi:MAG: translation initiation factor IF-2 [Candidatus Ryanbacteria bacterium RIFCSPHIGHO2_12_FULL_47_12b]|nr:MAG: translation initiation factor IF-2 [Candidatus Ryanbacteria bacterium RIFCSPHIGHO2_12_FULL_47_12b]
MNIKSENSETQTSRHPVVVILGHVDHGKTTLLDFIRSTSVVASEHGGITQHLGAYEINWNGKKITFLDTPGHETFSKMRARGARVADVAVLVVAADDGVKPQTKESLEAIQNAHIPFVVALNKIDKATADLDRVKSQLAEVGVLVEGWGGTVPVVGVSAKDGTHVDELLETVFLLAELSELRADLSLPASGVVIESHLDARRGPSALLLITNGVLKNGVFVRAGDVYAPVRILENSEGDDIDNAFPSQPVTVVGFSAVPPVGSPFQAYETKHELEQEFQRAKVADIQREKIVSSEIGVMIKADTLGSYEALLGEIQKVVPPEISVNFFAGGAGEVTEVDIKNISSAKHAFIVGFHTKVKKGALDLAVRFNVEVRMFDIIYEAIDWVKAEFQKLVPKKIVREELGKLLVLKTFGSSSAGRLIGGRVREGRVVSDARFEIMRQGESVGQGSIASLQKNRIPVRELSSGEEGGLLVHAPKSIEERDILVFFYEREA